MTIYSPAISDDALQWETLVSLLRSRAQRQPDRRAYTFLVDRSLKEEHRTYAEIDRQARAIAARLQALGAEGERAILLFQPGLDYLAAFFGCLYAGVVAVPAYPPRLNRSMERIQAIVADAQPALALTSSTILAELDRHITNTPDLDELRWLTMDDLAGDWDDWEAPQIDGDSVAFLQYTSGSTARPKGVVLTHRNLLSNLALIQKVYQLTPDSCVVSWLPPYHDMGLIGGILEPCFAGFPAILMAPVTFLQHPYSWLHAISKYQATSSPGPNFAYELCLHKVTPEQRATLDLSSWTVALNGSEPVRNATLQRFTETFAECGFRPESFSPAYGLAEATLLVSGGMGEIPALLRVDIAALEQRRVSLVTTPTDDSRVLAASGRLWAEQSVTIVDPETGQRCAPDEIGEIWVSGPSIARGYWNRPEDSEETFNARIVGSDEGPFLRTGDLGFIHDDHLYITGRIKDLIIIDGRNHYPQDIEQTAEASHPAIRPTCTAAFSIDGADGERLVVAAEIDRHYLSQLQQQTGERGSGAGLRALREDDEVARAIRLAVSREHDLGVHAVLLLRPGGLPKTSSGKIQRQACRAGYLSKTLDGWAE